MIFSELYSAYYNTVAKIMEAAFNPEATEKDLQRCVMEEAFSESVLTILPALKSGKWPLLHEDLSPVLLHKPTMPLTNLEKRWLKAISEDPRVKLFGVKSPSSTMWNRSSQGMTIKSMTNTVTEILLKTRRT